MAVGLVTLAGLAGCTSGNATSPSPSSSTNPATSTTPKSEIADPLNLATFAANTCTGLTNAQVAPYLGVPRTKIPKQTDNGPVCAVLAQDYSSGAQVSVGVVNIATPTQELLYESQAQLPWKQKINPIAGYPSVNDSQSSDPSSGDCSTDVAVNATQSLHLEFTVVSSSDSNYAKPCTVSQALMAELIQNIKSGS